MIVVAGEALIDLIVNDASQVTVAPGGGPYNAARALGRLGAECMYLGVLADDRFGELLRAGLAEASVKLGCPTPTQVPTTLALAQPAGNSQVDFRFYLDGTSAAMLSAREAWAGLPNEFDALHIGTLALVVEPTASVLETLVEERTADHIIALDPNCRPAAIPDPRAYRDRIFRLMRRSDLIKVSQDDVDYLFPDGGFEALAGELVAGGATVIKTAGQDPIEVFASDGRAEVDPVPGEARDTVGAGDSFGATVLWALLDRGWVKGQALTLEDVLPAVRLGTAAAWLVCQRVGAQAPTLAELQDFMTAAER